MALTREKLAILLQTQLGMSRNESRHTLDRFLKIMKDTLAQGEDLLISGFGNSRFGKKRRRRGRNPQTKKSLIIASRKVVVFKASGVFRQRINEGSEEPA